MNKCIANRGGRRLQGSSAAGFSLMEMAIAVAVVAVTFIGIIGLLGVGLQTGQASTQQTMATNIADSIIADLRSTPAFSANSTLKSVRFQLPLPIPATTPYTYSGAPFAASNTSLVTSTAYFDVAGNFISPINPATMPANAVYAAKVYDVPVVAVGPVPPSALSQVMVMVRVAVSWPAPAPTGNRHPGADPLSA
jgi:prepilin-type N-terminal cleavage/methylation domain-containing protein